ncbi:hypothetical protein MRX96_024058 [Rhipicephalus microplus]
MASGVIVSYPSPAPHESRPAVFKKDRRIRHSKSDPVLMALSHNSFARCSEREHVWDSIDDMALEQLHLDVSDAITLEGLKSHYNCCYTCGVSWSEEQTCLDCSECGGYALHRPCPPLQRHLRWTLEQRFGRHPQNETCPVVWRVQEGSA